jgi:hypothetical protein
MYVYLLPFRLLLFTFFPFLPFFMFFLFFLSPLRSLRLCAIPFLIGPFQKWAAALGTRSGALKVFLIEDWIDRY